MRKNKLFIVIVLIVAVAAAILIARGDWDVKTMVNVEELNPDPFIELLNTIGLPTEVLKKSKQKFRLKKADKPAK